MQVHPGLAWMIDGDADISDVEAVNVDEVDVYKACMDVVEEVDVDEVVADVVGWLKMRVVEDEVGVDKVEADRLVEDVFDEDGVEDDDVEGLGFS